jgi:hypothetical protein
VHSWPRLLIGSISPIAFAVLSPISLTLIAGNQYAIFIRFLKLVGILPFR